MNPELKRILLVEDDPDIQFVASMALQRKGGFQIKICRSGVEALAEAPAFAPDLILMDVMMPHMDGPSTLAALRQDPRTASVPVVFLTAKVQPQEVGRYKEMGALDVILKPFNPMTLAQDVRILWNQHCSDRIKKESEP
jgi:CheY-like chemotaxis protein